MKFLTTPSFYITFVIYMEFFLYNNTAHFHSNPVRIVDESELFPRLSITVSDKYSFVLTTFVFEGLDGLIN